MNTIYLILTNSCNLRCNFCFYVQEPFRLSQNRLGVEDFSSVISQAAKLGFTEVSFTGGEPLLFDGIFELIKVAKERGLKTVLATNGSLFTPAILKRIKEAEVDEIYVSLSEYFINDVVRTGKGWKRRLEREMAKLKGEKVFFVLVITRENLRKVEEVIKFFKKKQVPLLLQPAYVTAENKTSPGAKASICELLNKQLSLKKLGPKEKREFQTILDELLREKVIKQDYFDLMASLYIWKGKQVVPKVCHFPSEDLVVDADGSVKACFHRGDLKLGNVLTERLESCIKKLSAKDKQAMAEARCFGEQCISLFR